MKTVIFSHPWNGSFNKAILDKVVEKLEETKEKYTIIDLNKDKFNPVMTEEELINEIERQKILFEINNEVDM